MAFGGVRLRSSHDMPGDAPVPTPAAP